MTTTDSHIDNALDTVLKASGSGLRFYTCAHTLSAMREAMRKVMGESYILGSNTQDRIIKEHYHLAQKAGVFDEKQTRNKTLSAAHDSSLSPQRRQRDHAHDTRRLDWQPCKPRAVD